MKKIWTRILRGIKKNSILLSFFLLLRNIFSSTIVRGFIDFIAAILASIFTFTTNGQSYTLNFKFVIPFYTCFFLYLVICHICTKNKNKALRYNDLYKQIHEKNLEIAVMQNTLFFDYNAEIGNTTPLDIIAQNTCQAVHDIICDFLSISTLKVTIIKRCTNDNFIQMCGFYGKYEKTPGLYKKEINLNHKKYNSLLCVSMFNSNSDSALILRDEKEVKAEFKEMPNRKINTKQFIALPGIVNNKTVVLLQIASKKPDVFNENDFNVITNIVSQTFLEMLCNTYQIETHILNNKGRRKGNGRNN